MSMHYYLGIGPEFSSQKKVHSVYLKALFGFFCGFLSILWDKDGVSFHYWDKIKG